MKANEVLEICTSTNDYVQELGRAGFPHGTWISAHQQTKGRGRYGRSWISEEGGLFLSVLLRPERRERWSWIPLQVGARIAEILLKIKPGLQIRVKWPNDVLLEQKKVAGILCEAQDCMTVGVGMNCKVAPTVENYETAALPFSAEELRMDILGAVLTASDFSQEASLEELEFYFFKYSIFSAGDLIERNGKNYELLGLSERGELKVRCGGEIVLLTD